MRLFRRLQFRLLLVLIVVASIPIGVVSLINYTTTTQLVTQEVEARQAEVTVIVSEQVTLFVRDIVTVLRAVGQGGFGLGLEKATLNDYIANYITSSQREETIYKSIWLMDADGDEIGGIINGQPIETEFLVNRHEDEIFFRPQRGEIYFSNVRVINGTPEISLSVPIYGGAGEFMGAVGAIIDLETTWDVIRELQLGQNGYAMLLDRRGNVMVHRDVTVVDARYNLADIQPFASALRDTPVDVYYYDSVIGGEVIGSALPIQGPSWVLLIERPTNEAFAPISQASQNMWIGLVVAILISSLIGLWLSRQIARPIVALRNMVSQFGAGVLDVRSNIHTHDEIGQLSEGFNIMADRLKTRIDEINLKNEELQYANEKVLEASRLKDEFLAVMSHELRTPLSAILGFSGLLLMDGGLTGEQAFQLQRIETNSERLLKLINDILDITRIQAGHLSFHPISLDIRQMTQQIHEQLSILAKEKGIAFTYHIADNVPHQLILDEDAIIKIITNLCANGIKFTHNGSVSLNLSYENATLFIRTTDTGIGIPEHMQDIIFEEFRQVDSSSRRSYGGTGLGLAIVRRLVAAMGGRINVKSKVNEGSVFTVTLPLIEPKMEGML